MFNGICLPSTWPPRRNLTHKVTTPPYLTSPPAVIDISVGRQLFVDDFLVDTVRSSGLERHWPQPQLQCVRQCYFRLSIRDCSKLGSLTGLAVLHFHDHTTAVPVAHPTQSCGQRSPGKKVLQDRGLAASGGSPNRVAFAYGTSVAGLAQATIWAQSETAIQCAWQSRSMVLFGTNQISRRDHGLVQTLSLLIRRSIQPQCGETNAQSRRNATS